MKNESCPRCGGSLFEEYDDMVCLSCGYRKDKQIVLNACPHCGDDVLLLYKHQPHLCKCCGCSRILNKRELRIVKS